MQVEPPNLQPKHLQPAIPSILDLPTEILILILRNAAYIGDYLQYETACHISLTCRRFHELLLPFMYGHFSIQFKHVWEGSEPFDGCLYPRERLELFREHGRFVKSISVKSEWGLGDRDMWRVHAFKWEPSIPGALGELAPGLKNLQSVEITRECDVSVRSIFDGLDVILSNCLAVTFLKLRLRVSGKAEYFHYFDNLTLKDSVVKPCAQLQKFDIWLAQSTNPPDDQGGSGVLRIWGRVLEFPQLKKLALSFYPQNRFVTDEYIKFNYDKIKELKLSQTHDISERELLECLTRFPNVEVLNIDQLDGQHVKHVTGHRWGVVGRMLPLLPKLRKVITFTIAERGDIEKQLGSEILRMAALNMSFHGVFFPRFNFYVATLTLSR
ncbi:hypothetical protein H072_9260 [Dactylellina haptotyla CBS 200.50]|uniref:F-box domain-containing protein n=1 Tax=Dactylellina haptotyla (strain CBS 200.50) TaxID=1284197 RepID=S8BD46_DACHA|nr:hypothetical protein H072_9260 [Dactylellina haptotyla CBS 200.50]